MNSLDLKSITQIIDELNLGKKLILWGAGKRVNEFLENYCETGLLPQPFAICDSTRALPDTLNGIKTVEIGEIRNMHPSDVVLVITAGLMELQGQIVKHELYYHKIIHRLSFDYYFYLKRKSPDTKSIISIFNDDTSRAIFLNRVQQILDGVLFNSSLYSYPPYFGNDVNPDLDQGPIVFAGAFNGKHIDNMLRKNPHSKIYAYEPSLNWSNILNRKYLENKNIKIHNLLLWNEEETIRYDEDSDNGGLDARVIFDKKEGGVELQANSIDNLITEPVGTIILDVEGSEQKVIAGAKSTIEKYLPTLCICVYHTPEDYFEIPIILSEKFGNSYNFYLRQHSVITRIETVLYAMPK